MKKILSILLFILLLTTLGGITYFQNTTRKERMSQLTKTCDTISSNEFASERAHGVILRDRTIAAVRLKGEKNFSPPGGHIEVNESPEQALVRELSEELSINTNLRNFKPYKTYCEVLGATKTLRTYVYFVDTWDGILQVKEGDQLKWVTYEYRLDPDADTELVILLDYLKQDNLID